MNHTHTEVIDIIDDLNDSIFTIFPDTQHFFEASYNGVSSLVTFSGNVIWCSEDDERAFSEVTNEYEDLKPFLIKRVFKLLDNARSEVMSVFHSTLTPLVFCNKV